MLTRSLAAAAVGLLFNSNAAQANPLVKRIDAQISPAYPLFSEELPIPPVKQPKMTVTNPSNGKEIRYYEIELKTFKSQVYPDLGPAELYGYDGMSPGPTFMVPRGVETVVRFVNNAVTPNSVHLHGSFSRAAFDGWAEDTTKPGEYKDYYYPNLQAARTLWYHDHAMDITAENAYRGEAGMYIIHDPAEDALNLPSGYGEYDIPMVLTSKRYQANGDLVATTGERNNFWGDVIQVNGKPWPFMNVEPRKYRFRFLDATVSRSFGLYFADVDAITTRLPFKVIASDAGLLETSVDAELLYISMAERYEIVFDFSKFAGKTIELKNLNNQVDSLASDTDYTNTDKVMRFKVAQAATSPDNSVVPLNLRDVPFPEATNMTPAPFVFTRTGQNWTINGKVFSDVQGRLLRNVSVGTVERWSLQNPGGGWTHPIHIHLVDFRIVSRTSSRRSIMPYERGLKDVVWLGRQETVVVEAHYAPFPGLYMFHCHNLIHEDHEMMAAFNATVLPDYGYNATYFVDPMEEIWRPRPYQLTEFSSQSGPFTPQAITTRINEMAAYNPYAAYTGEQ
jgi:bilirubin oxidase